MVLSWSLTEVIRYSYYTLSLLTPSPLPSEPALLIWLRYTTFYLLYPTGAGSEAFTAFVTLPELSKKAWREGRWDLDAMARFGLFCVWWPGEFGSFDLFLRGRRDASGWVWMHGRVLMLAFV